MKIAGFVPLSLCDYPGHIAAVVFTRGCNFKCPFCHNWHLIAPESEAVAPLDVDNVLATIEKRLAALQGVVVSGGEPTLQKNLASFLTRVKELGLKTKLDTNGAAPHVLRSLLEKNLLDYVAMDIKAPWCKYDLLTGVNCDLEDLRSSVKLIRSSGVDHQFRTTRYHELLDDRDYAEIKKMIPHGSPHVWQEYRAPVEE